MTIVQSEPVVVIMAKQPVEGRTKTRLCPPLTPAQAAALYDAMLWDTVGLVCGVEGVKLALAITPSAAADDLMRLAPTGTVAVPVDGVDIGQCLDRTLKRLLSEGYPQAIALNSDGPTLPPSHLLEAVARLKRADVVLGPSEDGGYYLIGLKRPEPGLFQDIAWSTEQVAAQTLARAEALGLRVELLPTWYDVDTAADLERLRSDLSEKSGGGLPNTVRFLTELGPC